jgi:nitrogen-specific signal transduction histidine kinase
MNTLMAVIDCDRPAQEFARQICDPINNLKGALFYLNSHAANEQTLREITTLMQQEISRLEKIVVAIRYGSS